MAINRAPGSNAQANATSQARLADAQQNAAGKEAARAAQRATSYNGTLFTNTSQAQNGNPAAPHKFANLMRNRKRANLARARRNTVNGAGDDEGAEVQVRQDEMDALNGGRGGGGGRQQEQHEQAEIGAAGGDAAAPGTRPASAQAAPPSRLDAVAGRFGPGEEAQRAEAVRNAWHDSVRELFQTAGDREAGPWAMRLNALTVALQQIEMKIGPVGAGGVQVLREMLQHVGQGGGGESFHHILPLAMLRASYRAGGPPGEAPGAAPLRGRARRGRGGALQQSVGAGLAERAAKAAQENKA
ncbi:hypothetical protein [Burkholderia glumae]|uniref:hypothetical protein n=1 Tax=Burkholderia glumae TaxID=337 RepID=UPI001593A26A|nr:hypothetical protein [Burkholderia glumae]MCM2551100.1 hypothetical protein [Burkholderia glumae]NVE25980.1 hypothetical protein [Burkholderia glumae]